jgi:hypothetical protein
MKILDQLPDGGRLVRLTREDWECLQSATEIAFEDETSIPRPIRKAAVAIWEQFHAPENVREIEREIDLQRRAIHSGGALTPGDVDANDRDAAAEREGQTAKDIAPAFKIPFDGEGPNIDFYAWPESGSFLGVSTEHAPRHAETLWFCPMNADGTADKDNVGEVENIEGIDLDEVNRFFGSAFLPGHFMGR